MDEGSTRSEALHARIQQLEQERDELRKELEQLCMQQAGPSYIAVATQMHFRRTAGLEQEIENLKKKLESSSKENSDLKWELSEANRSTRHLDELHKLEVAKNTELAKQLELFNGVVAAASAEREHARMEALKAKENEDMMSQKLIDAEKRKAGLEQVIENLEKKLESSVQQNLEIKQELSEAKRITEHLNQLHKLEVTKNKEVVEQLELLQGVVATASAERDHAMMENMELVQQLELFNGFVAAALAERDHAMVEAKENEDMMSWKLSDAEKRMVDLEQEIENLKEELESYAQENLRAENELSEAKRITKHLDQLHKLEVAKNTEVVGKLERLQGVVDTVSAERDHAMMEAVKAKDNEDLISQKLNDAEKRLQELTLGSTKTQESLLSLQIKLAKQEQEMGIMRKTIDKFYKIRQHASRGIQEEERGWDYENDDIGWDEKCAWLSNDPPEVWSFNAHQEAFTADYVFVLQPYRQAALHEQLETLKCSVDDHRDKLQKVQLFTDGVSSLREYHAQQRIQIMDLLDDEKSYLRAVVVSIEKKLGDLSVDSGSPVVTEVTSSVPNAVQPADSSKTMTQALQDKVLALLHLSQQEEKHLLDVRMALRGTLEELQRNLKQATEEKVDALMELADVKQEYQLLLERTIEEKQQSLTGSSDRRELTSERNRKLNKLLRKRTSLKRWFGAKENLPPVADPAVGLERSLTSGTSILSTDDASLNICRLQSEIAALKDNMLSLNCLTSNIRNLRLSFMQAMETPVSEGMNNDTVRLLEKIIWEAELVKNALGSPIWSDGDITSSGSGAAIVEGDPQGSGKKSDPVLAAGLEMVELLILAAQITKQKMGNEQDETTTTYRKQRNL